MNTALQIFEFEEIPVRIHMDKNGNPWFVAKDVCRILEIEWKGSGTIGLLDEDERDSVILNTLGGDQSMLIISESGLYSLIFRSRKPEAKRFRKWVTAEVLPAIRKTGMYALPDVSVTEQRKRESVTDAVRLAPSAPFGSEIRNLTLTAEQLAGRLGITDPTLVEELSICFCKLFRTREALDVHPEKAFLTHENLQQIWDTVKRCDLYKLLPSRLAVFRQICAVAECFLEETLEERLEQTARVALENYAAVVAPTGRAMRFEITVNRLDA